MEQATKQGKKVKAFSGSLIKRLTSSDKESKTTSEEKDQEKEKEIINVSSEEEEEGDDEEIPLDYPEFLIVLPPEDFTVPTYGVKEDDSTAEKFLRKKIGTTLDSAKAYKKRFDNLESKKKKVATAVGSPILSTAISIKSTWTDPKSRAAQLEGSMKGLKCVRPNYKHLRQGWKSMEPVVLHYEGAESASLKELKTLEGGAGELSPLTGGIKCTGELGGNLHVVKTLVDSEEDLNDEERLRSSSMIEGGWRQNIIYKQHPHRRGIYLPLDEYHRYISQEKLKEFLDIMIALGAKSIHYSKSKVSKGKEEMSFEAKHRLIPFAQAEVKGQTFQEIKKFCEVDIVMREPPGPAPIFDAEARGFVWYQSEPAWSAVIDSRIRSPNVSNLDVVLSNTNDYGTSGLEGKVRLLPGVKIGGGGGMFLHSEHEYRVKFFTSRHYEKFAARHSPKPTRPLLEGKKEGNDDPLGLD